MRRDQYLFFPWFDRRHEARLTCAMGDPATLHRGMIEYLRAGSGYDRGYRAAFSYDPLPALRSLTMPAAIVASEDDVLYGHLDRFPADLPVTVASGRPPTRAPT